MDDNKPTTLAEKFSQIKFTNVVIESGPHWECGPDGIVRRSWLLRVYGEPLFRKPGLNK